MGQVSTQEDIDDRRTSDLLANGTAASQPADCDPIKLYREKALLEEQKELEEQKLAFRRDRERMRKRAIEIQKAEATKQHQRNVSHQRVILASRKSQ